MENVFAAENIFLHTNEGKMTNNARDSVSGVERGGCGRLAPVLLRGKAMNMTAA